MAGICRIVSAVLDKSFDELEENLDRMSDITDRMLRAIYQRLVGLELDARQPHLATEEDASTDEKTSKRMENAEADQAKHNGDSCSAQRVDAGPTSLTSFGMKTEPPALPRRDGLLVNKGAQAPKPCLSPLEMRTLTASGGLRSVGTASTAMRTISHQPPLYNFSPTKEIDVSTTPIQYAMYSSFGKRRVLETKTR